VVFRCNVRASTSKSIQLHNPSSTGWQLRPVIQNGDSWSGPEFVQVGVHDGWKYGGRELSSVLSGPQA